MLRRASILLAALMPVCIAPLAEAEVSALPVEQCPAIPDQVGRAGMVAVYLPAVKRSDVPMVMMTGGANFPDAKPDAKTPEERGAKAYYAEVYVLPTRGLTHADEKADKEEIRLVGSLPAPVGYAAYAPSPKGMVVAGGCNVGGHVATVTRTMITGSYVDAVWEDRVESCAYTENLPPLPVTLAYPAFAVVGDVLYVMGGQERADSTVCLEKCFALELKTPANGWKELAPMPAPRMLAAAGVVEGKIYVAGGCSLHPDANGNAERTYLDSVLCYDPAANAWTELDTPAPQTIVGAANPMPEADGKLYLICGDPGDFYRASLKGEAPETHPGQNTAIYSYTPATGKWEKEGDTPLGIATAPAVQCGDTIRIISGETHPGVRTPVISTLTIKK